MSEALSLSYAGIGLFLVVPLVILLVERIIAVIRAETVLPYACVTDRLFALKACGHVEVACLLAAHRTGHEQAAYIDPVGCSCIPNRANTFFKCLAQKASRPLLYKIR